MAKAAIGREYTFQSAHYLPMVPDGHKCKRLHGHTYTLEVMVHGPIDLTLGWVADFAWLDAVVEPLVKRLDHNLLNEVPGLENPTSELICWWFWQRLSVTAMPDGVVLDHVSISENGRSLAIIDGVP